MKRCLLLLAIICISITTFAQQSHRDTIRNNFKQEFLLNPFSFFVGGFEVGYGSINAKQHNRRLFAGYYYSENPGFYNDESPINNIEYTYKNMEGFRLEGQYLFMKPTDGGLRFYGGAYAIFKTIKMDITKVDRSSSTNIQTVNYNASATSGSVGIMAGARNYIMDNLFVDLYVGGGITMPFSSNSIDDVHLETLNPYKRSINPRAGITFGLAF